MCDKCICVFSYICPKHVINYYVGMYHVYLMHHVRRVSYVPNAFVHVPKFIPKMWPTIWFHVYQMYHVPYVSYVTHVFVYFSKYVPTTWPTILWLCICCIICIMYHMYHTSQTYLGIFPNLSQKCDQPFCEYVSCVSYVSCTISCITKCICVFSQISPKNVTNYSGSMYHAYHMYRVPYVSYVTNASGNIASSSSSSSYPCASVVATVVRMPRSEVSERHRAGSWVWVVSKSRLEVW